MSTPFHWAMGGSQMVLGLIIPISFNIVTAAAADEILLSALSGVSNTDAVPSSNCVSIQSHMNALVPAPLMTLLWILRTMGYIVSALLFVLWWFQGSLLYMPSFGRVGEGKVISSNPRGFRSPAEYGMRHEEIWLQSGTPPNSIPLHAWLVLQPGSSASRAPTVIFFHGNAGNIGYRLPNIRALVHACGCNVFIIDYRGYGCSAGEPSEVGLIDDAVAALEYLRSRSNGGSVSSAVGSNMSASASNELRGALCTIDASRIHLFGRRLGGAVDFLLAALDNQRLQSARMRGVPISSLPPPIAGVIVENSFTSLEDMVLVLATRMGIVRPAAGSVEEAESLAAEAAADSAAAEAQQDSPSSSPTTHTDNSFPQPDQSIPIPAALATVNPSEVNSVSSVSVTNEGRIRQCWRIFLSFLMTNRWESIHALRRMGPHTPLLLCSGLADELVPSAMMSRLYSESIRTHPNASVTRLRTLHTVDRGTHNDTHIKGGMLYFQTIEKFFNETYQTNTQVHTHESTSH
jgi:pimeloyl-ACP methyl ester carboxylesterase